MDEETTLVEYRTEQDGDKFVAFDSTANLLERMTARSSTDGCRAREVRGRDVQALEDSVSRCTRFR